MTRYFGSTALLFVTLTVCGVRATAQSDRAAIRKAIQARYDSMNAGLTSIVANKELSKYKAGIEEYTTPDFTWSSSDGKQKADQKAVTAYWIAFLAKATSIDRSTTKIEKLNLKGDGAVEVIVRSDQDMTLKDPRGKSRIYKSSGTSRDVWVKTSKGWKARSMKDLSGQQSMEGKVFTTDAATYFSKTVEKK
jgi:hypothetical protein